MCLIKINGGTTKGQNQMEVYYFERTHIWGMDYWEIKYDFESHIEYKWENWKICKK